MSSKQYEDPQELRNVQLVLKKMLKELDRVCRELDIEYVVWGGTAIGAVRHDGFIPWDDDIDIAMPRKDYDRFLAEAPAVLGEEFGIDNMQNEPGFTTMVSYLVLKDTVFIPEFFKNIKYRKPFSLDISPLDKMPADAKKLRRKCRRTWFWGRLLYVNITPTPYVAFGGLKKSLVMGACTCAHYAMKALHVSPLKIQRKWEKIAKAEEDQDLLWIGEFSDYSPRKFCARYDEVFPGVDHKFEDLVVKIPRDYDPVLTRQYGDYMKLPPEEDRKNHYPSEMDFGDQLEKL